MPASDSRVRSGRRLLAVAAAVHLAAILATTALFLGALASPLARVLIWTRMVLYLHPLDYVEFTITGVVLQSGFAVAMAVLVHRLRPGGSKYPNSIGAIAAGVGATAAILPYAGFGGVVGIVASTIATLGGLRVYRATLPLVGGAPTWRVPVPLTMRNLLLLFALLATPVFLVLGVMWFDGRPVRDWLTTAEVAVFMIATLLFRMLGIRDHLVRAGQAAS